VARSAKPNNISCCTILHMKWMRSSARLVAASRPQPRTPSSLVRDMIVRMPVRIVSVHLRHCQHKQDFALVTVDVNPRAPRTKLIVERDLLYAVACALISVGCVAKSAAGLTRTIRPARINHDAPCGAWSTSPISSNNSSSQNG
jgi:hypothetical protein